MANGYDCSKHARIEERLYKLESEDRVMEQRLKVLENIINELKKDMKNVKNSINELEQKIAGMSVRIAVGGVVLYTMVNILIKKLGG